MSMDILIFLNVIITANVPRRAWLKNRKFIFSSILGHQWVKVSGSSQKMPTLSLFAGNDKNGDGIYVGKWEQWR